MLLRPNAHRRGRSSGHRSTTAPEAPPLPTKRLNSPHPGPRHLRAHLRLLLSSLGVFYVRLRTFGRERDALAFLSSALLLVRRVVRISRCLRDAYPQALRILHNAVQLRTPLALRGKLVLPGGFGREERRCEKRRDRARRSRRSDYYVARMARREESRFGFNQFCVLVVGTVSSAARRRRACSTFIPTNQHVCIYASREHQAAGAERLRWVVLQIDDFFACQQGEYSGGCRGKNEVASSKTVSA
ncbi:hypothetical protein C8J57DRAFT_1238852 [Mycena rebaudengoi]|nr:hypothetical protein C8J57DRAFT_1238852 [Mycena rebaudengoi]